MKLKRTKKTHSPEAPRLLDFLKSLKSWPHNRPVVPQIGPAQMMLMCGVHAIAQEAPEHVYIARLINWIEDQSSKRVNKGQVYGTAKSLVNLGCLEATTTPHPLGAGRSVEIYSITPYGEAVVQAALHLASFAISKGENNEGWQPSAESKGGRPDEAAGREVRTSSRSRSN